MKIKDMSLFIIDKEWFIFHLPGGGGGINLSLSPTPGNFHTGHNTHTVKNDRNFLSKLAPFLQN